MFNKFLVSAAMIVAVSFAHVSLAADECNDDKDCKDGKVCILAVTPHACKEPQAAGAACKRDAVCASKKCDIPAGGDKGICK
jgi:hypothetical protein